MGNLDDLDLGAGEPSWSDWLSLFALLATLSAMLAADWIRDLVRARR